MAVISNVEWKLESAWITALEDNADLVADIRRHMDVSEALIYPCVVVQCSGSMQPPEWAGGVGYDVAFIELTAFTYREDDKTGKTCADLIGAIRDSVRDVNLLKLLNQEVGLTVYGFYVEGFSTNDDDARVRQRSITVRCHATCSDIPDLVSSSSSTSSFNESSSSSSSSSSMSSTSELSSSSSSSSSTQAGETSSSTSSTSESSFASSLSSLSSSSLSSSSSSTSLTSVSSTSESTEREGPSTSSSST